MLVSRNVVFWFKTALPTSCYRITAGRSGPVARNRFSESAFRPQQRPASMPISSGTTKRRVRKERKIPYDDLWRIPDALWEKTEPLLPPGKPHPLVCHNPPVEPRKAMNAIFFVVRTGCQWNALNATGICSSSAAHRWFQEWTQAGVFLQLWKMGLIEYDRRQRTGWRWQSLDGAMTKAPLGGKKAVPTRPTGPNAASNAVC
jgi:transposase